MGQIIVSYRRSDSAAIAGRIFDRLVDRYGDRSVFMDIDDIPFGTDFRQHIQGALSDAGIMLAIVGPSWLGRRGDGRSRIGDPADPVRVEIETALRQGLTLIPVLVDNAPMPGADDLPESIRAFAYINAAPVDTGRDFRAHMERLFRSIDSQVGAGKANLETILTRGYPDMPSERASRWSARRLTAVAGSIAIVLGGAVIAVRLTSDRLGQPPALEQTGPPNAPVPEPRAPPATPPSQPAPSLAPPPARPAAAPTYRVLANVSGGVQNLRSGPAVTYPVVVAIPAGATGIALGICRAAEDKTRPWCAATWRGYAGWISSCCIVDEKTGLPPNTLPPKTE